MPSTPRREGRTVKALLSISVALLGLSVAATAATGDLLGDLNSDGRVDSADLLLLKQHLNGIQPLTADGEAAADLGPVVGGAAVGDGLVDAGDMLILMKLLRGEVGPAAPTATLPVFAGTENPIVVEGTATDGVTVHLFVNGVERGTQVVQGGSYSFDEIPVFDGANTIHTVSVEDGLASRPSGSVVYTYTNVINRIINDVTLPPGLTVWTKGTGPESATDYMIGGQQLVVPSGSTLHVLEEAKLVLAENVEVIVEGTLVLEGARDALVGAPPGTSQGSPGTPLPCEGTKAVIVERGDGILIGDAWDGITFRGTSATGRITNACLLNASQALILEDDASVYVSDSAFVSEATSGNAIQVVNAATLTLADSNISVWSGHAVLQSGTGAGRLTMTGTYIFGVRQGVEIQGAATGPGVLDQNFIDASETHALSIDTASPVSVTGNTIKRSVLGITVGGSASPTITGNRIIDNCTGIQLLLGATPEVNRNTIDNTQPPGVFSCSSQIDVDALGGPYGVTLDFEANWWGTDVATEIDDRIGPDNDPFVDFLPFLDAEDGNLAGITFISGPQSGSLAVDEYDVVGTLSVASGQTVTLNAGTTLKFFEGAKFEVDGTLTVSGAAGTGQGCDNDQVVKLTSAEIDPAPGDWQGVVFNAGAQPTTFDYVCVEHADRGLDLSDATATITNSTIQEFGTFGIRSVASTGFTLQDSVVANSVTGGSAAVSISGLMPAASPPPNSGIVHDNTISGAAIGLQLIDSSPEIQGNVIEGNAEGLSIAGASSPVIDSANRIRNNCSGVVVGDSVGGQPTPVVTGNSIHANSDSQLPAFCGSSTDPQNYVISGYPSVGAIELNAIDNWWGGTDGFAIGDGIVRSLGDPLVQFVPFLDEEDGSPMGATEFFVGLVGVGTTLPAAPATAKVVGDLAVAAGDTLTVADDVTFQIRGGTRIDVYGTLTVNGTASSTVLFDTDDPSWEGFLLTGSGAQATIAHAEIRDAEQGFIVEDGADLALSDSDVFVDGSGIEFFEATGQVADSSVTGNGAGIGIDIESSSPTVSGTTVQTFATGVSVSGASNPVLGPGNQVLGFAEVGVVVGAGATATIDGNVIDSLSVAPPVGTGLRIVSASPAVTDNLVQNAEVGVEILGGAAPTINAGNEVTANETGFLLVGTGTGDPAPVINDNAIYSNTVNLETVSYSGSSATIDAKHNYWGSIDEPTILASIIEAADRPVIVDFSSYLDGIGGQSVGPAGIFSSLISGVIRSRPSFVPARGESVSITFETAAPGQVTVTVYQEDDAGKVTVWEEVRPSEPAGAKEFVWDGTSQPTGDLAPNEAYAYAVAIDPSDGINIAQTYDPPRDPEADGQAQPLGVVPATYNPHENEPWRVPFTVAVNPGRITFTVTTGGQTPVVHEIFKDVPFAIGSHEITFDGRSNGNALLGPGTYFVGIPQPLKPNHVIVTGSSPRIRGKATSGPPTIEIKSDPYLVRHSYDQVTKIAYCLDRTANVTIQVREPVAAGDNVVADLLTGQLQQATDCDAGGAPHVVEWRGYDDSLPTPDTNDFQSTVSGSYTFSIQAVDPAQAGLSTTLRGIIQVRQ